MSSNDNLITTEGNDYKTPLYLNPTPDKVAYTPLRIYSILSGTILNRLSSMLFSTVTVLHTFEQNIIPERSGLASSDVGQYAYIGVIASNLMFAITLMDTLIKANVIPKYRINSIFTLINTAGLINTAIFIYACVIAIKVLFVLNETNTLDAPEYHSLTIIIYCVLALGGLFIFGSVFFGISYYGDRYYNLSNHPENKFVQMT